MFIRRIATTPSASSLISSILSQPQQVPQAIAQHQSHLQQNLYQRQRRQAHTQGLHRSQFPFTGNQQSSSSSSSSCSVPPPVAPSLAQLDFTQQQSSTSPSPIGLPDFFDDGLIDSDNPLVALSRTNSANSLSASGLLRSLASPASAFPSRRSSTAPAQAQSKELQQQQQQQQLEEDFSRYDSVESIADLPTKKPHLGPSPSSRTSSFLNLSALSFEFLPFAFSQQQLNTNESQEKQPQESFEPLLFSSPFSSDFDLPASASLSYLEDHQPQTQSQSQAQHQAIKSEEESSHPLPSSGSSLLFFEQAQAYGKQDLASAFSKRNPTDLGDESDFLDEKLLFPSSPAHSTSTAASNSTCVSSSSQQSHSHKVTFVVGGFDEEEEDTETCPAKETSVQEFQGVLQDPSSSDPAPLFLREPTFSSSCRPRTLTAASDTPILRTGFSGIPSLLESLSSSSSPQQATSSQKQKPQLSRQLKSEEDTSESFEFTEEERVFVDALTTKLREQQLLSDSDETSRTMTSGGEETAFASSPTEQSVGTGIASLPLYTAESMNPHTKKSSPSKSRGRVYTVRETNARKKLRWENATARNRELKQSYAQAKKTYDAAAELLFLLYAQQEAQESKQKQELEQQKQEEEDREHQSLFSDLLGFSMDDLDMDIGLADGVTATSTTTSTSSSSTH